MKFPAGFEEVIGHFGSNFKDILDGLDEDTICELKKTIYGLIQAALMWYKWYNQISDILVKKLSLKKTGEIIICLYVDNSAMMGEE